MNSYAQKIITWREDPVRMLVDEFNIQPDKWQANAFRAFADGNQEKKRVSLQACAGPGKTMVEAACGLNFLACYGDVNEHPKGAAVSITKENLSANLWPEFAKLMNRSMFFKTAFEWTKTRIYAKHHPETWFIEARSFSKDADPEQQGRTLSGLHAKRILFLIDESGDIPVPVLKSAEQALSSCTWGRIVQAGNPTSHQGMLYAAATKNNHQWNVIRINGDPEDPERSPRIDKVWAEEQIQMYGRDDPWVMAYILGQFPPGSINSLLSIEEVDEAMRRAYNEVQLDGSQKRLGIDVAREGLDKTSLFPRQGLQAYKPVQMSHAKGHDVAARAMLAKERWGWEMCFVDNSGGYGGSVCDSFVQGNVDHIPVSFGGKAADNRYFDKRSEMLFKMAEWVKNGGALPDIPSLREEMPALKYSFMRGKLKVIEKDQIKKQIGRSPDDTDALALTFALPEMPGQNSLLVPRKRMASEFDPFAIVKKPQVDPLEKFMVSRL